MFIINLSKKNNNKQTNKLREVLVIENELSLLSFFLFSDGLVLKKNCDSLAALEYYIE